VTFTQDSWCIAVNADLTCIQLFLKTGRQLQNSNTNSFASVFQSGLFWSCYKKMLFTPFNWLLTL